MEHLKDLVNNSFATLSIIIPIGLVIIGGAIIIGLSRRFSRGKAAQGPSRASSHMQTIASDSMVTANEMQLFKLLSQYVEDHQYTLLVKPRVVDTVQSRLEANNTYRVIFERIKALHTDFVLCNKDTLVPVIGIELDDKSHNRADRKRRDALVNRVFDAAQIPLLHLRECSETTLPELIDDCIGMKQEQFSNKPQQPDTLRGVQWNFKIYGKPGNYNIYKRQDKSKISLTDAQAEDLALYVATIRCLKYRENRE